jgi:hypothetical protein
MAFNLEYGVENILLVRAQATIKLLLLMPPSQLTSRKLNVQPKSLVAVFVKSKY